MGMCRIPGSRTVTGITVQVVFGNDEALAPQIDTVPLTLIRTKEPYIDTQPLSANPLKPGDDREFRLTFESVPDNWNQQMPEVRVIQTNKAASQFASNVIFTRRAGGAGRIVQFWRAFWSWLRAADFIASH